MNTMLAPAFLGQVRARGAYLAGRLAELVGRFPGVLVGVRGMGLIQGLVLTESGVRQGPAIIKALFERGVLANFAGGVALRFIPPLIVNEAEIDRMIEALAGVLAEG